MSRKNRSKFIAFPLNNNQICKGVFVQHDGSTSRQIDAHQPPASHHRHGLDSPAPTTPKPSTQAQHIAGQHQRTAKERQHPGERTEGDSSTKAQRQNPGEGENARQEKPRGQRQNPGEPAQQPRPAGGQRTAPADAICQPVRHQSQHRPGHRTRDRRKGKRGEKGEGKRNGQKMTV